MTNYLDVYFIAGTQDVEAGQLENVVKEALEAGITAYQFREKGDDSVADDPKAVKNLAKKLQALCQSYDVPFIVDDNVDLAIELDADGIHVGQGDEDIESVIARVGADKIIGLSTSNAAQVKAAQDIEGLSYIGVGPVFHSLSKDDTEAEIGVDGLRTLITTDNSLASVAIGGITAENAKDVRSSGVDGLSVITAIAKAPDIAAAVKALKA